jgi:hypothetical protein
VDPDETLVHAVARPLLPRLRRQQPSAGGTCCRGSRSLREQQRTAGLPHQQQKRFTHNLRRLLCMMRNAASDVALHAESLVACREGEKAKGQPAPGDASPGVPERRARLLHVRPNAGRLGREETTQHTRPTLSLAPPLLRAARVVVRINLLPSSSSLSLSSSFPIQSNQQLSTPTFVNKHPTLFTQEAFPLPSPDPTYKY